MRLLIIISFVFPAFCYAQRVKVQNLQKYDQQWLHFGFTLGINKTDFMIRNNPDIRQLDSVYIVQPEAQSGFNLGIVSNLHMGRYFDLRFIPALSFVQRNINYTFVTTANGSAYETKKIIESTFLDFPLILKYKSMRIGNARAYILAAFKYTLDLASQAHVKDDEEVLVKLKKHDFAYEIGFGLDFYLEYFKFSPEIKLGLGLNNMLHKESTVFANSVESLRTKVLLVSFMFE